MKGLRPTSAATLLLLGACATNRAEPGTWRESDFSWSYKKDSGVGGDDGPLALYGPPETLASHIFACDKSGPALEFAEIEGNIYEGKRPISIEARGTRWSGTEQLDPPDAVPVSRASIPLSHPLVDALVEGGSPIVIRSGTEQIYRLPNHPFVGRVIQECRAAAGKPGTRKARYGKQKQMRMAERAGGTHDSALDVRDSQTENCCVRFKSAIHT